LIIPTYSGRVDARWQGHHLPRGLPAVFTSQFIPGGTKEQADWFTELQRITVSPETAVRITEAGAEMDVTDLLPRVKVPTLAMHAR